MVHGLRVMGYKSQTLNNAEKFGKQIITQIPRLLTFDLFDVCGLSNVFKKAKKLQSRTNGNVFKVFKDSSQ